MPVCNIVIVKLNQHILKTITWWILLDGTLILTSSWFIFHKVDLHLPLILSFLQELLNITIQNSILHEFTNLNSKLCYHSYILQLRCLHVPHITGVRQILSRVNLWTIGKLRCPPLCSQKYVHNFWLLKNLMGIGSRNYRRYKKIYAYAVPCTTWNR